MADSGDVSYPNTGSKVRSLTTDSFRPLLQSDANQHVAYSIHPFIILQCSETLQQAPRLTMDSPESRPSRCRYKGYS